jgi:hypothetical protein
LKEPAFMAPVLATFVHALPAAFTGDPAPAGTTVEVVVGGEGAWRLWTKGIGKDTALAAVSISGDRALGRRVLDAVAIIG